VTCPACGERLPPAPGRCAECRLPLGPIEPCPPDEAAALDRSRERLEVASSLVGASGLVLLAFVGLVPVLEGLGPAVTLLFVGAGLSLLSGGLCLVARLKGRSPAWGALGLLGCLGLVALHALRRACRRCGARWRAGDERCPGCGAPP
jgi:hypothetical protein